MKGYTKGFCAKCHNADKKLQLNTQGQRVCQKCYADTDISPKYKSDCLLDMDKEFFADTRELIIKEFEDFKERLQGKLVYNIEIGIPKETCKALYAKHFPNLCVDDLGMTFTLGADLKADIDYTYKGYTISPKDYYVRPKGYIEVPTKIIIEECVSCGTPKPDLVKNKVQEKLIRLAKEKLSE